MQWAWISNRKGPGAQEASGKTGGKAHEDTKGLTDGRRMLTEKTGWGEKQDRYGEPHLKTGRFLFSINFLKFK